MCNSRDGAASQPRTGSMLLTVNVLDINDNAPEFSAPGYSARINESAATGSFVVQVAARDRDQAGTDNSRVHFAVAAGGDGDQFDLDADTGVLTTNKPLQCADNVCQLGVVARDHGSPRQQVRKQWPKYFSTNFKYFPRCGPASRSS